MQMYVQARPKGLKHDYYWQVISGDNVSGEHDYCPYVDLDAATSEYTTGMGEELFLGTWKSDALLLMTMKSRRTNALEDELRNTLLIISESTDELFPLVARALYSGHLPDESFFTKQLRDLLDCAIQDGSTPDKYSVEPRYLKELWDDSPNIGNETDVSAKVGVNSPKMRGLLLDDLKAKRPRIEAERVQSALVVITRHKMAPASSDRRAWRFLTEIAEVEVPGHRVAEPVKPDEWLDLDKLQFDTPSTVQTIMSSVLKKKATPETEQRRSIAEADIEKTSNSEISDLETEYEALNSESSEEHAALDASTLDDLINIRSQDDVDFQEAEGAFGSVPPHEGSEKKRFTLSPRVLIYILLVFAVFVPFVVFVIK